MDGERDGRKVIDGIGDGGLVDVDVGVDVDVDFDPVQFVGEFCCSQKVRRGALATAGPDVMPEPSSAFCVLFSLKLSWFSCLFAAEMLPVPSSGCSAAPGWTSKLAASLEPRVN
jgi:hypothetical protein